MPYGIEWRVYIDISFIYAYTGTAELAKSLTSALVTFAIGPIRLHCWWIYLHKTFITKDKLPLPRDPIQYHMVLDGEFI